LKDPTQELTVRQNDISVYVYQWDGKLLAEALNNNTKPVIVPRAKKGMSYLVILKDRENCAQYFSTTGKLNPAAFAALGNMALFQSQIASGATIDIEPTEFQFSRALSSCNY